MQIISPKSALKEGLKYYFTGKPCCHGHVCRRYVKNGACVECRTLAEQRRLADARNAYASRKQHDRIPHLKALGVISYEDAARAGLKRFFTGEPCENGHVDERYIRGGHCLECHRINARNDRLRVKSGTLPKFRQQATQDEAGEHAATFSQEKFLRIVSRNLAASRGLKRFFTGEACKHAHIAERYVLNGNCVECATRASRNAKGKHPRHASELPPLPLTTLIGNAVRDATLPEWEIVSREEAKSAGQKRFFTGKLCDKGHMSPQYVHNMECVECSAERKRNRYATDAEFRRKYISRETERNRRPEVRSKRNASARDYYKTREFLDKVLERLRTDNKYYLVNRIKTLLRNSLKKRGFKKGTKLEAILGCSKDFFVRHIERQFLAGMSWKNRSQWHLDHIVALTTANTVDDIIALFHHTNLRPVWAHENWAKGAKPMFLI
jgi:hypothetical protein